MGSAFIIVGIVLFARTELTPMIRLPSSNLYEIKD